jgi:hypothetical protein
MIWGVTPFYNSKERDGREGIMSILREAAPVVRIILLFVGAAIAVPAHAETFSVDDGVLAGINAQGITAGDGISTTCSTGSSSICQGQFDWNDNHQFDSSNHKGAIEMDGYVQQNVVSESNVNATQSAIATGVNVLGNVSLSNGTFEMNNTNNATSFIGGF